VVCTCINAGQNDFFDFDKENNCMNKIPKLCLSVTFLLILAGCSEQQKKIPSRHIPFPSPRADVVKVMTFNIRVDTILDGSNRWNNRKELVFDTIADNRADVIGLQEALDFQVTQTQQALPQYANYAAGRSNGKQKGETCAIFYRKDRFALADSGTFWFSNKPSKPGSKGWGNFPPRICSWIRLLDRQTRAGFYVYNVHLDNLSQNSRKKSVELLAHRVGMRAEPEPFIVMGDFNMELDNPAMMPLQKTQRRGPYPCMVDAWESVHGKGKTAGTGTRHGFRGGRSGPKIDHIPVCEDARPLDVKIDRRSLNGRYPSDHFPVVASILLPNTGQQRVTAAKANAPKPAQRPKTSPHIGG
jgi:endonuclease/exonuclease/phosphatase family metal-dependent hydrolase